MAYHRVILLLAILSGWMYSLEAFLGSASVHVRSRASHVKRTTAAVNMKTDSPGTSDGQPAEVAHLSAVASQRMAVQSGQGVSRRDLLKDVASSLALGLFCRTAAKRASAAELGSAQLPVAVVGAAGKTGRLCVQGLLRRGKSVRAVTRGGDLKMEGAAEGLENAAGDVTKPETMMQALKGTGGVIFCSSASKKGGNAEQVDNLGVVNCARACRNLGVARLVIISSGAVTKPNSLGYKVTNLFGGIMAEKRKGELGLLEAYAGAPKGVSYTIVRPGGLTSDPPKGVKSLELNQGDTIGGTISRADLAEVLVEALLSPDAEGTTFEVFDDSNRGPLQGEFPLTSGYERKADSYTELFRGLKKSVGNVTG